MMEFCTLDDKTRECDRRCKNCGWSLKEQKRRENMLAENGLEPIRKSGLLMLVIEREESEE